MSRESAAEPDARRPGDDPDAVDLRSLDEGIAILNRFQETLAQMELVLDSLRLRAG